MALGRVKTWISEILTAADLNAEFNNILNNATSLISPLTAALDFDGKEAILDADADTSITADTDDQIDFKVGGTDHYRMTASGFSTLSSATITSAGALTVTAGGATVTAGNITATAGDVNLTAGAINTARATVASAATTADIWAANGNQIDWTGTVTCTGFPAAPQAGVERVLICAGAAPFTAGANMLIDGVTTGNTVTCAANDIMIVRAVTTTQFRLSRVKYDGTAQVAAGGLTLLSTVTASASATVDVETTFSSTYDAYLLVCSSVLAATPGSQLLIRYKLSGAYVSTATYSYHQAQPTPAAATYSGFNSSASSSINTAMDECNLNMFIHGPASTTLVKQIQYTGSGRSSGTLYMLTGVGTNSGTGALTGIRLLFDVGNISSGTFRLYGISNS